MLRFWKWKRDHHRRPAFEQIMIYGGKGREEGILRDISLSGARVRISTASPLPRRLKLWWPTGGYYVDCQIRWRSGTDIGIKFDHTIASLGPLERERTTGRSLPGAMERIAA